MTYEILITWHAGIPSPELHDKSARPNTEQISLPFHLGLSDILHQHMYSLLSSWLGLHGRQCTMLIIINAWHWLDIGPTLVSIGHEYTLRPTGSISCDWLKHLVQLGPLDIFPQVTPLLSDHGWRSLRARGNRSRRPSSQPAYWPLNEFLTWVLSL